MTMNNTFDFNAPQYIDFNSGLVENDGADTFFDIEPEESHNKENLPEPSHKIKLDRSSCPIAVVANSLIKKENSSPLEDSINMTVMKIDKRDKSVSSNMKKREILKGVRRLSLLKNEDKPTVEEASKAAEKLSGHLQNLSFTKDVVQARKRKSSVGIETDCSEKYMALAEETMHFQRDTLRRPVTSKRRSFGNNNRNLKANQSYDPSRTIESTPKLMTSQPVEAPSEQEREEEEELKEIQKNEIKANSPNDKIFQSPRLPPKCEKTTTVQQPDNNLTTVLKKLAPITANELFRFTAKPTPKKILEKPVGLGQKNEMTVTVSQSSAITKPPQYQKPVRVPATSNVNSFGIPMPSKNHFLRSTELKPFSFEVRDKEMLEKKEKKIQEILLEEKRAREFKAKPAPTFNTPREKNRLARNFHLDCSKSYLTSVSEEAHCSFKARSPKVLRKAPFEPKLDHTHSQPLDIKLWTERRVRERQEFEMKQAEMEMQQAILREQIMLDKKLKEDEEIAKLRQVTVHKAQPMPKFKPPPQFQLSSAPLTDPKSPRFSKRLKNNK